VKRIFCFDLDGTITECSGFGLSEKNIPWQILWIGLTIYRPKLRDSVVLLLKELKDSDTEIIIITKRPQELEKITTSYLKKRGVLYDKIFFVGPGPDSDNKKIEKIKKENVDYFFDNNREIVKKAKEEGIVAFLI